MGSRETDYSQHSHQHGTVMPSKNIILVSSPGLAATRTRRAGTEKNYNLWAGGSATLDTPDTNNSDVILAELECVPSVVKYKVQSQHSQLLHPAEEPRSDGPAEPEHSGASDLTVTSTLTAECHTTSACLYTFIYDYVLLPLSSLVACKVRCLVQNKM